MILPGRAPARARLLRDRGRGGSDIYYIYGIYPFLGCLKKYFPCCSKDFWDFVKTLISTGTLETFEFMQTTDRHKVEIFKSVFHTFLLTFGLSSMMMLWGSFWMILWRDRIVSCFNGLKTTLIPSVKCFFETNVSLCLRYWIIESRVFANKWSECRWW